MKVEYKIVDAAGLAAISKEMRQYAIAHPITDYDAFAAECQKPHPELKQERINDEIIRSRGSHVPDVMKPYTRFVSYCGAQLQLMYLHVTDPKVSQPMRQLNVIDNWGIPLGFLMKGPDLETLVGNFLDMGAPADFKKTPGHVIMAFQRLPPENEHIAYYPKSPR